jgi:hypothetical protein
LVLTTRAVALAASLTLAASALAGEPGGFRPGLFTGEVGGALFASTPSIGIGILVLIPALGTT